MKEIHSIEIRGDRVRVKVHDRDATWGWIRNRQQMTFRRRQFEQALRDAEIVVPWDQVKQD